MDVYEHPIEKIMNTAMSRIKSIVEVDTVVGSPVVSGNTTVIPVSKVTVGLVAGGGEYGDNSANKHKAEDYPFAGGSGAGVSVQPIGFLIRDEKGVRLVTMDNETAYDKLLGLVPELVGALFKDKDTLKH